MKIKRYSKVIVGVSIVLLVIIFLCFGIRAVNPDNRAHFTFGYVGERQFLLPRTKVARMASAIDHTAIRAMYDKALDTSALVYRVSERDLAEWTVASFEDSAERNEMIADYEKKAVSAEYTLLGSITVSAR